MWTTWKNYSWVSGDCPSLHAPHDWCAVLRGLRVVFIGDSIQYQAFLSLLGLLHAAEWASVANDFQLDWKRAPPVQLCGDANTTVYFVRNDWSGSTLLAAPLLASIGLPGLVWLAQARAHERLRHERYHTLSSTCGI